MKNYVLTACFYLALGAAASADEPARAAPTGEEAFFEARIRPILAQRCFKCHGPERSEGELRLDSYEGIMTGGVSGGFALPGKPDESLLLIAVSYQNEDLQMPPDAKLPEEEIDALKQWILKGVPHPDEKSKKTPIPAGNVKPQEQPEFWALKAPQMPQMPAVGDTAWPASPIDRFLLADLQAHGLSPRQPADKHTLLRRVSLDLIGLPPTPQEMESFIADRSPDAFAQVVDRLLESPHYGERWARHWLDVARYADSNGLDENVAHGNAWRYRDYVIQSFNNDKPFDRFVREQIAGDLLPAESNSSRHEQLIATGFLSLGAKVLAEVDERKMEMDIVDEQIDTLGRALLGLTLGCARCHDHKFDPIRIEDYYALAGIFRSTKTMENFTKVARWNENVIANAEETAVHDAHTKKLADQKAVIARVVEQANQALLASLGANAKVPADAESRYDEKTKTELKKLRDELKQLEKAAPALPSAMGVIEGTAADTAVCIRGSHLTPGQVVPRGVPLVLASGAPKFPPAQSGRKELADWLVDRGNPLTARVIVNRIWRWHFGRGLVESTDNFGQLGSRPTNQPLLDWLAVWFTDNGWSIKKLHRLIVTSAAYCQASSLDESVPRDGGTPQAIVRADSGSANSPMTVDPDNRMLWHFPVRRLEAEAIRDSLLAVSGQLDTTPGGSLMHVANRGYLFDHTSKDETKYDSRRRSIYLPVIRNNLYDVFQLFDSTDATVPSGDRASSTVATQALFMMNSSLLMDSAEVVARISLAESEDDRRRVTAIYERCLGRPPTESEIDKALAFVEQFRVTSPLGHMNHDSARAQAWTAFCHAVLASNEFVFVR